MSVIKDFFKKMFSLEFRARYGSAYIMFIKNTKRKHYAKSGKHTELFGPLILDPQYLELDNYTRISPFNRVISAGGRVIIKKFSAIGSGCTFAPGSHIPTVGMPQFLSRFHLNDAATEIIIDEDVWIGANCTFLSKAHVCRGAVVGAGSIVTKEVPPYAVVAGSPARVIAVRFSLEQILKHEESLYPKEERLSHECLEELFNTIYKGLHHIGTDEIPIEDRVLLNRIKKEYNITDYAECK